MQHLSRAIAGASLLALILVGAIAAPAQASNGKVSASVKSHNGGGSYVSANLSWTSATDFRLKDFYVNDRCNSKKKDDGLEGFVRVWAKRDHETTLARDVPDLGGCKSAPVKYPNYGWGGVTLIYAAGMQACVGKYHPKEYRHSKVKCGKISWRANHKF